MSKWIFRVLFALFVVCGLLFLVGPIGLVIQQSFNSAGYLSYPLKGISLRWYEQFFSNAQWIRAAKTGFVVAATSALLSTVMGTMAAWALARLKFRGKDLVYAFLMSPMVTPTIVLGLSYYFFFGKLHWIGNPYALVVAYAVMGIPYVLMTVSGALVQLDPATEQAAATLGANPWQVLWYIILPRIDSAIFGGGLFAFVVTFDEVIVINFLGGGQVITLARQMWNSLRYDLDPTLAVAGTILIVISLGIFVLSDLLAIMRERRRQTVVGRLSGEEAIR